MHNNNIMIIICARLYNMMCMNVYNTADDSGDQSRYSIIIIVIFIRSCSAGSEKKKTIPTTND